MLCPNCRYQNDPGSKFCSNCGTKLPESSTVPISSTSELRQVTAMFCDLVGSTALSDKLDPEEYSRLVLDYQLLCKNAIDRFEGEIHEFLGDGVITFFGYPVAHEDDAIRSVRCGLEILQDLEGLNKERKAAGKEPLAARIGIHTGPVVAGEMAGRNQVLGKTPNIAARLEALADVNSVVISPSTYKLVKGYFEVAVMGSFALKGITAAMEVFKVLRTSGKSHRLDIVSKEELSPFVGREREVDFIQDQWKSLHRGVGKVILVKGDAGIGKSRLIHQIKEQLSERYDLETLTVQASSMLTNSALYPLVAMLADFLRRDNPEIGAELQLEDLQATFADFNFDENDLVVLADLVSIPLPDKFAMPYLSAARQKQISFDILTQFVLEHAARKPLLLLFEDLHWADHSTLEWASAFVEQVSHHRILSLFTTRPMEKYPEWVGKQEVSHLTLSALNQQDVRAICEFKCKGIQLPTGLIASIADKADGIPLYVEEFTSDILESGDLEERNGAYVLPDGVAKLKIPTTLQDSLTSRLDRHPQEKVIAQLGAILGRDFSYEILREVSDISEELLQKSLNRLQDSEILYVQEAGKGSRYIFKHALIQDAAYDSLLQKDRQSWHRKVASVIDSKYPHLSQGQPELVAHHLTLAGQIEDALPKWMAAGKKAMQRNANIEAVSHLEQALEICERLPRSIETIEKEIQTLLILGSLYTSTHSSAGREVEECYERALELSRQSGSAVDLFYVNCGLVGLSQLSGQIDRAFEITEKLFEIAANSQDPTHHYVATSLTAWVNMITGNHLQAEKLFKEALPLFDEEKHAFLTTFGYGDFHCVNLEYYEFSLLALGQLEYSLALNEEARLRMKKMDHLQTNWAYYCDSGLSFATRRDYQKLLELSEICYPMAVEAKEEFVIVFQKFYYGLAKAQLGHHEMIEMAREGVHQMAAIGNLMASSWEAVILVELEIDLGHYQQASDMLDWIDGVYTKVKGRYLMNEERHRVRGWYFEKMGQPDKAEHYYLEAIKISRSRHTKFFELRASNNLGRLWATRGKSREARELIANVFNWFSDDVSSSVDLLAAQALLEELRLS